MFKAYKAYKNLLLDGLRPSSYFFSDVISNQSKKTSIVQIILESYLI